MNNSERSNKSSVIFEYAFYYQILIGKNYCITKSIRNPTYHEGYCNYLYLNPDFVYLQINDIRGIFYVGQSIFLRHLQLHSVYDCIKRFRIDSSFR